MGTRRRGRGARPADSTPPVAAIRTSAAASAAPAADAESQARETESQAREICLRLLASAPRTRAQLASALRRRGIPDPVTDAILERFTEVGLIDDAAFARAWVESRHYSRGLSRRALAVELRQRGVADEEVRDAIGELDPDEEAATARQLVSRKLASTRGQPPRVRTRRLAGVLARKGYPAAMVFRIVREALEQEGIDAAEAGLDEIESGFDAADTELDADIGVVEPGLGGPVAPR